jgi:hypothetical protein
MVFSNRAKQQFTKDNDGEETAAVNLDDLKKLLKRFEKLLDRLENTPDNSDKAREPKETK